MMRRVKGQALTELGIMAGIVLVALAFLVRVGMKMNYDQEIRMAAFRRAMAAAQADNTTDRDAMGTTFHYISHRQMPNPSDGFRLMPRNRTEASAFVEWGDRLSFAFEHRGNPLGYQTQPKIVVRSDNTEQQYRLSDWARPPEGTDITAVAGVVGNAAGGNVTASLTNTSTGRIQQTQAGSSLAVSSTSTSASTGLNAVDGPNTISSQVSGGFNSGN